MNFSNYLVDKNLNTFSPYEQENLLPLKKHEPDRLFLEIINSYAIGAEKIFCHICGSKKHNKGYTGKQKDGSLLLFGSTCANDYFDSNTLQQACNAFNKKLEIEKSEYHVVIIRQKAGWIEEWFARNESLISGIKKNWELIELKNKSEFDALFDHLDKNSGRLVETITTEASALSQETGKAEFITQNRILFAFKHYTNRSKIWSFAAHINLANEFINLLQNSPSAIASESIQNLDKRRRKNFLQTVDAIDQAINFSVEIFQEQKLNKISIWLDQRRESNLQFSHEEIRARDMPSILKKKIGYGYEYPAISLRDHIGPEDFLLNIAKETDQEKALQA